MSEVVAVDQKDITSSAELIVPRPRKGADICLFRGNVLNTSSSVVENALILTELGFSCQAYRKLPLICYHEALGLVQRMVGKETYFNFKFN